MIIDVELVSIRKSRRERRVYIELFAFFQSDEGGADLVPFAGLHLDGGIADDVALDRGKQRGV